MNHRESNPRLSGLLRSASINRAKHLSEINTGDTRDRASHILHTTFIISTYVQPRSVNADLKYNKNYKRKNFSLPLCVWYLADTVQISRPA